MHKAPMSNKATRALFSLSRKNKSKCNVKVTKTLFFDKKRIPG